MSNQIESLTDPIDIMETNVPRFPQVNDGPFRPDPSAAPYLNSIATNAAEKSDDEEEDANALDLRPKGPVSAEEKARLNKLYFTSGKTDAQIIAGTAKDLKNETLIQLRLTRKNPGVVNAFVAQHGQKAGGVKMGTLQRDFDKGFYDVAERHGVDVNKVKLAFNSISDVSYARPTGWKRPDVKKKKKKGG